ncbi:11006_t:CDS:2, partial [Acaulospora colombiana]
GKRRTKRSSSEIGKEVAKSASQRVVKCGEDCGGARGKRRLYKIGNETSIKVIVVLDLIFKDGFRSQFRRQRWLPRRPALVGPSVSAIKNKRKQGRMKRGVITRHGCGNDGVTEANWKAEPEKSTGVVMENLKIKKEG